MYPSVVGPAGPPVSRERLRSEWNAPRWGWGWGWEALKSYPHSQLAARAPQARRPARSKDPKTAAASAANGSDALDPETPQKPTLALRGPKTCSIPSEGRSAPIEAEPIIGTPDATARLSKPAEWAFGQAHGGPRVVGAGALLPCRPTMVVTNSRGETALQRRRGRPGEAMRRPPRRGQVRAG
jgi:hypothetical protein